MTLYCVSEVVRLVLCLIALGMCIAILLDGRFNSKRKEEK